MRRPTRPAPSASSSRRRPRAIERVSETAPARPLLLSLLALCLLVAGALNPLFELLGLAHDAGWFGEAPGDAGHFDSMLLQSFAETKLGSPAFLANLGAQIALAGGAAIALLRQRRLGGWLALGFFVLWVYGRVRIGLFHAEDHARILGLDPRPIRQLALMQTAVAGAVLAILSTYLVGLARRGVLR